jgi:peptide/nickel transport system substrate-binding protein
MPRTFQATVALIVTLAALAMLTLVNVWQTHSTESQVIELSKHVKDLQASNQEIKDQLKQGVAVSGVGSQGASGGQAGKWVDPYASEYDKPGNILKTAHDELIFANAKQGGTLRRSLGDDMKGFNWLIESSVDVSNLQTLVHNTFVRRDMKTPDNFVSDLVYKVEINPEFTEYTFHLRKGVMWHVPAIPDINDPKWAWVKEPRELTAEDCVFTFELLKNPQVEAASIKSYFDEMDHAEVVDKYTFKVIWKKKTYQSLASTLEMYPLPKWLFTKDEKGADLPKETMGTQFNNHWASQWPIGTGPYKFLSYKKGEGLELVRNEAFFGEKPPIAKLSFKILKDPEQNLLNLKADQLDVSGLTPGQYKTEVLDNKNSDFNTGKIKYQIADRFAYYYIGWNAENPIFGDKLVRRAMTNAFNRQGIVDSVYNKLGVIQTGPLYYDHPGNDPGVKPYPFDLEQSKKLLDEAGWKDTDGDGIRDKVIDGQKKKLEFVIMSYQGSKEWGSALSVFKEDLRKIGVAMDFSPVDWPTMQKKMDEKKFDAYTGGWGLSWDTDMYQIWHSSQADEPNGSNRVAFKNKRADEIIMTLRETFDEAKRLDLLHEFHRILHEEQPYTFFFAPKGVLSWQPRVKNVVVQKIRPQYYELPWYIDESGN